jgi:hypothetical protein
MNYYNHVWNHKNANRFGTIENAKYDIPLPMPLPPLHAIMPSVSSVGYLPPLPSLLPPLPPLGYPDEIPSHTFIGPDHKDVVIEGQIKESIVD